VQREGRKASGTSASTTGEGKRLFGRGFLVAFRQVKKTVEGGAKEGSQTKATRKVDRENREFTIKYLSST